jgi:cyanophycin synthetase
LKELLLHLKDLKDLANVKSLVVEAVKDEGYAVINGDDPVSLTIIDKIKSNMIVFSKDENNPYLRHNLENGSIGIYLKEENIYYQKGNEVIKIVSLKNIPITLRGKVRFNIENSMAKNGWLSDLFINQSFITYLIYIIRKNMILQKKS